jgi:hypothetical protein
MTIKRDVLIAVITAAVGLATATAAIATSVGGVTPAPVEPPVSSVPASVTAAFAVFRRPATTEDEGVGIAAASTPQSEGLAGSLSHSGANTHLARHIGPTDSELFATVGQDSVCLYSAGGSTCAESSVALEGRLLTYDVCDSGLPANHIRVSGLALDGVTSITLKDANGAAQAVPVTENGFSALATGHVTEAEWTKDGNVHHEPITYPESAENNCINQH